MARILIVYASTEGQTQKIARYIGDCLRARGERVVERHVDEIRDDHPFEDYDGVIVGGSIHVGKIQAPLRKLVRRHRAALEALPNAFFMVSLVAASKRPEAAGEVDQLLEAFSNDTGWKPDRAVSFAGAMKYSQYGFIKRLIMRAIAKHEGGDTDTSRDYEYTRWESVEHFAHDFADSLARAA